MSSVVRPSGAQMTRRIIVLVAAVFAVLVNAGQSALGLGQSPAEFAADSDATLRAASYAFSIWGVIFLWMLVYGVRQALPQTGESDILSAFGWPSVIAFIGIGVWTIAAGADAEAATVVLIFASLIVLLIPLLTHAPAIRRLPRMDRDRWTVVWPLALLAGWLTVAAPLNLVTVATGNGDLPAALSPTSWAVLAIGVVTVAALLVTFATRTLAYPLPVAWGLLALFVGEQERNGFLSAVALGAAVAVLVGGVILAFRLSRRPDRQPAEA